MQEINLKKLREEQSKKFRENSEHCNSIEESVCEHSIKTENVIIGDGVELEDGSIMLGCGRVIQYEK